MVYLHVYVLITGMKRYVSFSTLKFVTNNFHNKLRHIKQLNTARDLFNLLNVTWVVNAIFYC